MPGSSSADVKRNYKILDSESGRPRGDEVQKGSQTVSKVSVNTVHHHGSEGEKSFSGQSLKSFPLRYCKRWMRSCTPGLRNGCSTEIRFKIWVHQHMFNSTTDLRILGLPSSNFIIKIDVGPNPGISNFQSECRMASMPLTLSVNHMQMERRHRGNS